MSTRCQLEFQNVWTDKDGKEQIDRRTVYRHSDGYPEGVIPDLKSFLKWNKGRNSDVEYCAANFIYWSKRKLEDIYLGRALGLTEKGEPRRWDCKEAEEESSLIIKIGFGVCNNDELHGDIQYFYEVISKGDSDEIIIKVYDVHQKDWSQPVTKADLKLKKTIKVINELKEE